MASAQQIAAGLACGLLIGGANAAADPCRSGALQLQVLGSGGPELQDRRASSSYLLWQGGKARVLVDSGGGSALRFGASGAAMSDLDVVLFTHLHADHSADFPALIKSAWFESRPRPLPVFGPTGNDIMPATTAFVSGLFDAQRGVFRYLGEFLAPEFPGRIEAKDIVPAGDRPQAAWSNDRLRITAIGVEHGPIPALAWRVELGGKTVVFSGDTNGTGPALTRLARRADILVAHNAVPEGAAGVERRLHMPPSVIGRIAQAAHVKRLVLSHRMLRTLGKEPQTRKEVQRSYTGTVAFADDLDCFAL